jgi:putative ABC transport system ATP-binding protein
MIGKGEFVAIMGPIRSGKSTAMNLPGVLDTPTAGSCRIMGHSVSGCCRDRRALLRRQYLGFMFQGYNLPARTAVLETVELPLIYHGHLAAMRRDLTLAALAKVGRAAHETHDPSER